MRKTIEQIFFPLLGKIFVKLLLPQVIELCFFRLYCFKIILSASLHQCSLTAAHPCHLPCCCLSLSLFVLPLTDTLAQTHTHTAFHVLSLQQKILPFNSPRYLLETRSNARSGSSLNWWLSSMRLLWSADKCTQDIFISSSPRKQNRCQFTQPGRIFVCVHTYFANYMSTSVRSSHARLYVSSERFFFL